MHGTSHACAVPGADPAAAAAAFAARHGAAILSVGPLRATGVLCLVLEAQGAAADPQARLRTDPEVPSAEPIRTYRTAARTYPDDLLLIQDAMHGMNVPAAPERSTGAGVPDRANRVAEITWR